MPPSLDPEKRTAIIADIKAGTFGRNEIARRNDVGMATVSRIAGEEGLTATWDRSATKNATEAARLDNAALRAQTSRRFLLKAGELLDQMDQPHVAFAFGGKDNVYTEHAMEKPPVADLRNLMITAATAFDKHLKAELFDGENEGLAAVDAWLRGITGDADS
jgi:hypothetical protein